MRLTPDAAPRGCPSAISGKLCVHPRAQRERAAEQLGCGTRGLLHDDGRAGREGGGSGRAFGAGGPRHAAARALHQAPDAPRLARGFGRHPHWPGPFPARRLHVAFARE
eukprot:1995774-Rhodomonas_salina.1